MKVVDQIVNASLITECSNSKGKITRRSRKRGLRNNSRRERRKRSKIRYYKFLKQSRYQKKTEDLCSAVTVIGLDDMECNTPVINNILINNPLASVAEWHKKEQVAYWKSRAISLEYENQMLHQHLRNVYAFHIQNCADYNQEKNDDEFKEGSGKKAIQDPNAKSPDNMNHLPPEPVGAKRRSEMKVLYGSNMQKIMGMETAMQLTYDRHIDKSNPKYWPEVPLNL